MPGLMQSLANAVGFCFINGAALTLYALRSVGIGAKEKRKTKEELITARNDERPQVVVVTGCDRGIGKLMAESWTSNKKVIVVALTLTEEGAASLKTYNEEHENDSDFASPIVPVRCDVTSKHDVDALKVRIESILTERNAVLYAIVNNAGIVSPADFVFYRDLTIPKKLFEVNFFGQLSITQTLLPLMLSTSGVVGGKIINMSSVCGTSTGNPGNSIYCASKHAVEAWSASLRIELEAFNIDVSTIRPGQTSTKIQDEFFDSYVRNYESAPDQIKNLYGGSSFAQNYVTWCDANGARDHSKMNSPAEVVDTVAEILASEQKPQPHHWVGRDAHTFFKSLDVLPVSVVNMIKSSMFVSPKGDEIPKLPPPQTVAHVTIRVRNLERSLEFYGTLGFEAFGPREGNYQFMQFNPSHNGTWESLVLLQEDPSMPERGACHHQGMTRLALLTNDMDKTIQSIKAKKPDLKPYAPMSETKTGQKIKIVAFRDPDGFISYFIEISGVFMNLYCWWIQKKLPCLFHWTVNVGDSKHAMSYFENQLGFSTMSDQNKDQVLEDLLPAFRLEPSTTAIEWIRLCNLPKGGLVATIMEWVSPKSLINATSMSNSMTLSVTDVQKELEKAKEAGLVVNDKPSYRKLPIYGEVLVGKAYLEKDNCPIEYCCFSNQKP